MAALPKIPFYPKNWLLILSMNQMKETDHNRTIHGIKFAKNVAIKEESYSGIL
jgi:hypothetical protein